MGYRTEDNMEENAPKYNIAILDKHEFLNGDWIGAGVVSHGENPDQVIGARFMKDGQKDALLRFDLSYQNALILAGTLIKACHLYDEMIEAGIDPMKKEA